MVRFAVVLGVTIQLAFDKFVTPAAAVPGFGVPYVWAVNTVTPPEVVVGLTQTG